MKGDFWPWRARFFTPANAGWLKRGPTDPHLVPTGQKGRCAPVCHLGGAVEQVRPPGSSGRFWMPACRGGLVSTLPIRVANQRD